MPGADELLAAIHAREAIRAILECLGLPSRCTAHRTGHTGRDRSGGVADPCGNQWWIGTHVEDVSAEEIARRAAAHKR